MERLSLEVGFKHVSESWWGRRGKRMVQPRVVGVGGRVLSSPVAQQKAETEVRMSARF